MKNIKDESDSFYKYFADDESISYTNLHNYMVSDKIELSLLKSFMDILDHYAESVSLCKKDNKWFDEIMNSKWSEFHFIPSYNTRENKTEKILNNSDELIFEIKGISQQYRVVFYAVCKYFEKGCIEDEDATSLKQWMRFVWNLVSEEDKQAASIRSVSAMKSAIDLINKIKDPHKVYDELAAFDADTLLSWEKTSSINHRFFEECIKARQIYDAKNKVLKTYTGNLAQYTEKTWEEVLTEAESHFVFRGYIPFLYHKDSVTVDWNDFDTKWANIQKFFDDRELVLCENDLFDSRMKDSSGADINQKNVSEGTKKDDFKKILDTLLKKIPKKTQ